MLVRNELSTLTPHLLAGLEAGECTVADILNAPDGVQIEWESLVSHQPEIRDVTAGLELGNEEEEDEEESESDTDSEQETDSEDETESKLYSPVELQTLIKKHRIRRLERIGYVVTPKLEGQPLREFVLDKRNKQHIFDSKFVWDVTFQVAQALSVFESKGIMHNDLNDQNVFIQVLSHPTIHHYIYPKEMTTTNSVQVCIIDFDRASWPIKFRNKMLGSNRELCKRIGQCASFIPKYDFYMFLTFFIGLLETVTTRQTKLREIYGSKDEIQVIGPYVPEKNSDASRGRPCQCVEITQKGNQCKACVINAKRLERVTSPSEVVMMLQKEI
jgi:serine/threonine protein kinase